jgi:hypothetical protein
MYNTEEQAELACKLFNKMHKKGDSVLVIDERGEIFNEVTLRDEAYVQGCFVQVPILYYGYFKETVEIQVVFKKTHLTWEYNKRRRP